MSHTVFTSNSNQFRPSRKMRWRQERLLERSFFQNLQQNEWHTFPKNLVLWARPSRQDSVFFRIFGNMALSTRYGLVCSSCGWSIEKVEHCRATIHRQCRNFVFRWVKSLVSIINEPLLLFHEFYQNLEESLEGMAPHNICNYDETNTKNRCWCHFICCDR